MPLTDNGFFVLLLGKLFTCDSPLRVNDMNG